MAANSDEKVDVSTDDVADKKPSKESLSQVAEGETKNDADLDQLLESALGDFDKPLHPPSSSSASSAADEATSQTAASATASPGLNILTTKTTGEKDKKSEKEEPKLPPSQDALFEALFNDSPAAQQSVADFENVLSGLMTELNQDPGAAAEMQKMFQGMAAGMATMGGAQAPGAGAPGSGSNPPTAPGQGDLNSTLTDTINRLAENARELQDDQLSDEDLMRSLGGMSLEEGEADLLPMVQNMMQSLLSKDVLYPSLKEVVGKYQGWLDENEPNLTGQDYERYCEQHELMRALCIEYEGEQESDSADMKQARMTKIMELIQKMESLGQPPSEIVGDMNNSGLTFDEHGLPKIPGLPDGSQCSVM